jgi:tRNA threonylcarbamoyladenosine biosynthesis protein TsaB
VADEKKVLAIREVNQGYTHAENLHVFIGEILNEAGLAWKEISAVAVSKGPGSYTGLRIGVSAAKGFCYALNIPLISVDTLAALTAGVVNSEEIYYCPMLDARRMEVYCAVYDKDLKEKLPVQALVLDEVSIQKFNLGKPVCFFGEGMPKAKTLLEKVEGASFKENIIPSAKYMIQAAWEKFNAKQFEDTAWFEPFYLKDFFTKKEP